MPVEQPPITIGELTNVPQPESGVRSPWAQAVSRRVIHQFASLAAAGASNLPVGGRCEVLGNPTIEYVRVATSGVNLGFARITPWATEGTGGAVTFSPPGTALVQTIAIPADPSQRAVLATCHLLIAAASAYAAGQNLEISLRLVQTTGGAAVDSIIARCMYTGISNETISPSAVFRIPANATYSVEVRCTAKTAGSPSTQVFGDPNFNRLGLLVTPFS